ncbi:MAG TPA: outer membrane lipoprotein-sorting protein, partial [Candidatus Kryptonia bacterium]|nr:outer membrane lipoprotein-sorting protein [Candidatus Kryptonia bacterium]
MTSNRLIVVTAALAIMLAPALHAETPASDDPSAKEIVTAADQARNPGKPFRLTSTLTEYIHGQAHDQVVLIIYAREDASTRAYSNLVRYAQPPRDAGKLVLLNASNLWFYDPAAKSSVRISAQQRLTGQASDGDVLTVNYSRDYTAAIVGRETIQDAERKDCDCWHLDLKAATADAVYNRIEYWVERGTYRSVKGKFYADSGRLLKIAYYDKYQAQLGGVRPTETILIDAVDSNLVTTIASTDYR